ncbi:MAG: 3-phosphoshikimate 1-carboxyvinyltransferase [Candidatus Azobacteroides sp.]|nr:3-phosphoshikimate 1-carboxyvinyltransferase [Candidatus Azobacteroides sp.]
MKYIIQPPKKLTHTSILLPASKSISNRALILKALSKSPFAIENLSDSDDTEVMIAAFSNNQYEINIGAAGTSMRFLTAYLAQLEGKEHIITGTERMKNRPIRILVDALRQLGADIEYVEKEGFPPLKIKGKKLTGGTISLDGSISSQYISALMMIAPSMANGLTLKLEGEIVSRPYIQLTCQMMRDFGVIAQLNGNVIRIEHQDYLPTPYLVESDWSAASYWYEVLALTSNNVDIELLGLQKKSPQGDAGIAKLFDCLGVSTDYTKKGIRLSKNTNRIAKFVYDFVNEPDMAQTFVVTCCLLNIPFRFTGLQSLRIKETDRISALQKELKKMGYIIADSDDSILEWNGEKCEPEENPVIDTYEDHRMAMAFAPASLVFGKIIINEPQVVSKSYPNYWKDLKEAGFNTPKSPKGDF